MTKPEPRHPDTGGDPACWLDRVCPDCGLLTEDDNPPARCPRCGAERT
ncbi:rubredoxin-like domain-containing protein [Actinophytocola oryzae]|nr:hypothetical protein [Actinophytocola oryzae]